MEPQYVFFQSVVPMKPNHSCDTCINNAEKFLNNNCKYYEIDQIPALHNKLCVIHINIHSIPDKMNSIRTMLDSLKLRNITVHFLLLCETFLKDTNAKKYKIPGYEMVYRNRKTKTKGGVAIYFLESYNFHEIELENLTCDAEFESIFIEIKLPKRNLVVGEIYRVPRTNEKLSIQRYENVVNTITHKYPNHDVFIGTDQNFDFLKVNTHHNTEELLNIFYSQRLVPTIDKPTRVPCYLSFT